MRRILDEVILGAIGQVNRLVFRLSRRRVILHRFRGVPAVWLTITTPAEPLGRVVGVAYLPDDDAYLLLTRALQEAELSELLDSSTAVEAARGPDETSVPAELDTLTDPAERSAQLKRVVSRASMDERAEARRLDLIPIARLRLHEPFPETGHPAYAVSIVTDDAAEPSPGAR